MRSIRIYLFIGLLFLFAGVSSAQNRDRTSEKQTPTAASAQLRSSAAFGEVLLRKVQLEASLEEMLVSYTDEYPKVKETRYELNALLAGIKKLNAVKPDESAKLTVALGKLIVKKAEVATNFWDLSNKFNPEHPEVMRAKKSLEIYDNAINEIL